MTQAQLGEGARTFIPRPEATYNGKVIGETDLHVLQQVGSRAAIAHFRDKIGKTKLGETLEVRYDKQGKASIRTERQIEAAREKARDFRTLSPEAGSKKHPDLAGSYAYLAAVTQRVSGSASATKLIEQVRNDVAGRIERGEAAPKIERRQQEQDKGIER